VYAITGASGNVGKRVSEILLEEGKKVRVIGRNEARLRPLVEKGAEPWRGSVDDAEFLTKAFEGASAVFAMIPPNKKAENMRAQQGRVGEVIATAIAKAKVRHVVDLSSLGAELPEGTGPVLGLHDQEERLNGISGVNVLHLRPTFFMENLFSGIPMIRKMGVNGSGLEADLKIPVIATRDVAEAAAASLLRLDFPHGAVKELLGERDISMNEMTAIIGKAIGRENLLYVQVPYADLEEILAAMGLSRDVARSYVELSKAFNDGLIGSGVTPRTAENTTGTSFEEFSKRFAEAYSASAA
jgi:uncharacterized protein YbjT (DUF2867 family)